MTVLPLASQGFAYERPASTEFVAVSTQGLQATIVSPPGATNCQSVTSHLADVSASGRFVAFASDAVDLVPDDTNGTCDIFVRDRHKHTTERVSVSSDGGQGIALASFGQTSISANGRWVAFASAAQNLVPGDTNTVEDVFVHDRKTRKTILVSVNSRGEPAAQATSTEPSISPDGRYVSFRSSAINLLSLGSDVRGIADVFLHDVKAGTTVRVSTTPEGTEPNGDSSDSSVSAGGRFVAFTSLATNLHPSDTDTKKDVFVRDLRKPAVELITVDNEGEHVTSLSPSESNGSTHTYGGRSISADGRFVVYSSFATGLVPGDAPGALTNPRPQGDGDAFLYDREDKVVRRVSVTSAGEEAVATDPGASISPDGGYVAFNGNMSGSTSQRVYIHNVETGATELVSVPLADSESESCTGVTGPPRSYYGAVSDRGQHIAFISCASNLVANDEDQDWDLFLRDRGGELLAGLGGDVVDDGPGNEGEICIPSVTCLPPDTRVGITDAVDDTQWLTDGGADLTGASITFRPQYGDLFIREQLEDLPSLGVAPLPTGLVYGFGFTVDQTDYEVRAQYSPGDGFAPSYGASFGLYRCDTDGCIHHVTSLRGGFGTTGDEVVFSLPLNTIGLQDGGQMSHLEVFTGLGALDLGSVRVLDSAIFN